jgi:tetratricopeptide (TPR) repeat protein
MDVVFGAQTMRLRDYDSWPEIESTVLHALCRALDMGGVIAFAGAGTSMDYGYPGWSSLAKCVVDQIVGDSSNGAKQNDLDKMYTKHAAKLMEGENPLIAREKMGILNYCNRLFVRQNVEQHFGEVVDAAIRAARKQILDHDRTKEGQQVFNGLDDNQSKLWEPERRITTLKALIDILRIRRFATTNYDNLIEQRLGPVLTQEGRLSVSLEDGSTAADTEGAVPLVAGCPSLDRLNASPSALINFAMGGGHWRYGVLHLHGKMIDPSSESRIVLTESQYQQHYEKDLVGLRDRRDAYDLLLQANSLLFVGTSLEDEDSLRPLRRFVADHDVSALRRPWFAILDGRKLKEHGERFHKFNELYYRYGIATIFTKYDPDRPIDESHAQLIQRIADLWLSYRSARTRLPTVRAPIFSSRVWPNSESTNWFMVHHANEYPVTILPKRLAAADAIAKALKSEKRDTPPPLRNAVMVLGRQGSGKGSFGYEVAQADFMFEGDVIRFYGTTLFANEFLTLIDGAADHICRCSQMSTATGHEPESRVARLFRVIRECPKNVMIVLGGIERVLRPLPYGAIEDELLEVLDTTRKQTPVIKGEPVKTKQDASRNIRWGRAANPEVKEFLECFAKFNEASSDDKLELKKKIIIVTSSISPVLEDPSLLSGKVVDELEQTYIARPWDQLSPAGQERWDRICRRLAHNRYAIDTIQTICQNAPEYGEDWLEQVNFDIRRTEFAYAPVSAINSAINFQSKYDELAGALPEILEILSLFSTPVEPSVFAVAFAAVWRGGNGQPDLTTSASWCSRFSQLHQRTNLLLKLGEAGGMYVEPRYTTHSLVRRTVLRRLGGRPNRPAEIQQFDLNDFASEPPEVESLSPAAALRVLVIFDAIMSNAESLQAGLATQNEMEALITSKMVRSRLRGAYALLRGGLSTTGLARLLSSPLEAKEPGSLYHGYHRRLTRLLNLVYQHAPPNSRRDARMTPHASLYPDELGWLLNELGLVCSSQGVLADALTYFGMGRRLNAQVEEAKPGYRSIVSKINTASVLIELARLRQARDLLYQAMTLVKSLGVEAGELRARIHGYIGLIAHLSGDTRLALQLYDAAVSHLHALESWRGVSVFARHKCDLLRGEARYDESERALREAIGAAEAGFHLDLVHYCLISEANLRRVRKRPNEPARPSMLTPTLQFAQAIGSAKIESDVYRIRGLIELENSDLEAATRSTMACLASSRANGLRLRMMSSMELLGRLTAERGYRDEARSIYRTVIHMGQVYEYERPMEFARMALAALEGR